MTTASLARLDRVARHLTTHDDPDVQWLGDRLTALLASEYTSADEALGLTAGGRGLLKPLTAAAFAERDRVLREAAKRFFPGQAPAAQARELHRALLRYSTTGWRRERTLSAPPIERVGAIEELLHRALRCRDHVVGERTIRAILAIA